MECYNTTFYYCKKIFFLWKFLFVENLILHIFGQLIIVIAFTKIEKIQIGELIFPDWTLYFGQALQIVALLASIVAALFYIIKNIVKKKVKFFQKYFIPQ